MSYRENSKNDFKSEIANLHSEYLEEQEAKFQKALNDVEEQIKTSVRNGNKYYYVEMSSNDIGYFLFWAWPKSSFALRMEEKLIALGFEPKARYSDGDMFGQFYGFRIEL